MAKYPDLYNELLKQHEESKALEQQEALARQSVAEGSKGAGIANTLLNTPTKYQILAKSAPQDNYKQLLNAYTGGAQAGVDNSEMMRKGGQERWKNTAETYKMMTDADYKNKMLGILKQKADAGTKKPSVGETAVDRAYAAEYAKDVLEGGSSDRASKLANLGEVINSFDTTAGLTGGPTSYLPNIARSVLNLMTFYFSCGNMPLMKHLPIIFICIFATLTYFETMFIIPLTLFSISYIIVQLHPLTKPNGELIKDIAALKDAVSKLQMRGMK